MSVNGRNILSLGSVISNKQTTGDIGRQAYVLVLKILRLLLGVTWKDKIRNKYTKGTAQAEQFGDQGGEANLIHVQRANRYIERRLLNMEWPARR